MLTQFHVLSQLCTTDVPLQTAVAWAPCVWCWRGGETASRQVKVKDPASGTRVICWFESDVLVFYWLVLTAVVQKVNGLIEEGAYGRLFAVVHFASRQWKVTDEDLILIENHIDAACGDRIRMEKVFSSAQTLHSDPHTDCCAARWPAEAQVQGWDFCTFWPQWEDPCKCFWVIVVIQMASWVLKQF